MVEAVHKLARAQRQMLQDLGRAHPRGAPTVHIGAFSLVGGARIRRGGPAQQLRTDRRSGRARLKGL
jgi:hypothetical protein